jgi:hypothetical protein
MLRHGIVQQSAVSGECEAGARRTWIPRSIHIITASCFKSYAFFVSISFESKSGLKLIESSAFSSSSLESIEIPRSVEILCSSCFSSCD